MERKPYFIITIDTEGDNLWARPKDIKTRNAEYVPRFHSLCRSYGLKPTYLVNYEMSQSKAFQEFGKSVIKDKTAEIGMHLHAWNTPPARSITEDDYKYLTYLVEYPPNIIKEKVKFLTDALENIFQVKMVSHRAGRYFMNNFYAKVLIENGYLIDCSVTPHISWKNNLGNPYGKGGPDYKFFLDKPYFINPDDISKAGNSVLLEVPVTIKYNDRPFVNEIRKKTAKISFIRKGINYFYPEYVWLRPNIWNLNHEINLLKEAVEKKVDYVEFILHSSELMPGGSPYFVNDKQIERLYFTLEKMFEYTKNKFSGVTLKEFHDVFKKHI